MFLFAAQFFEFSFPFTCTGSTCSFFEINQRYRLPVPGISRTSFAAVVLTDSPAQICGNTGVESCIGAGDYVDIPLIFRVFHDMEIVYVSALLS